MRRRNFIVVFALLCLALPAFSKPLGSTDRKLLKAVRSYLSSELKVSQADLQVTVLRTYPSVIDSGFTLLPMASLPRRGGTSTLPLDLAGKRGYVTIRFEVFVPVVVLKDPLRARQALSGHVTLEKKNARLVPWDAYHGLESVSEKESRYDLREGEILVPRDVTELQLVHAGDHCQVVVEKGLIEVRAEGQAVSGGKKDETIPVRLLENRKTVYARVVEPGLVRITISGEGGS